MTVLTIAFKDMLRSFRSWFAVGMMFVVPLLVTGLNYFAFGPLVKATSGGAPDLPVTNVAVVNLDSQPAKDHNAGRMLVGFLQSESLAQLIRVTEVPTEAEARERVALQEAAVAVIIPAGLSAVFVEPGSSAAVSLVYDPALSLGPRIVQILVQQFVDGLAGVRIAQDVTEAQFARRGQTLDAPTRAKISQQYAAWLMSPADGGASLLDVRKPTADASPAEAAEDPLAALMAKVVMGMMIFFAFFTGANAAMSIIREDEEGTLARLFTLPVSRAAILGGKFAGVFLMVSVQSVTMMAASAVLFGIDWGQALSAALALLSLAVAATGFGLLLMAFVKTTRQAGAVIGGGLTATGMMGGLFTTGIPNMPAAFEIATLFTPQGWALRCWKLVVAGSGPGGVLLAAAVLVLIGGVCFAAGAALFRRRFA